MDIGIRELKSRLSELVERAAQGETIRITDRGKLKAELGPVSARAWIDRGIAEGWISPRRRSEPLEGPKRRYRSKRTVQQALDRVRGD